MMETINPSSLKSSDFKKDHDHHSTKDFVPTRLDWLCRISTRTRSHHQHPARRKDVIVDKLFPRSWPHHPPERRHHLYISILLLISCFLSSAIATPTRSLPSSISVPKEHFSEELRLILAQLAESGTILVDQRPQQQQPAGPAWELEGHEESIIVERQGGGSFSLNSSSASPQSTSAPISTSSSTVASTTATSVTATATSSSISLPRPFDSSLGANFTSQACPNFITSFLNNATFQACLPISLLLQSSRSFFEVEKSIVRITQTLDYTCAANLASCTSLMSALALNLTSAANCGADFAQQNPTVLQAHTGLIAYAPLYQATCLKDPITSSYCFADAITNASAPSSSYIYNIALNQSLPGGTIPTCNTCLQNTMAVFDAAAANRSQPVASTYVDAAKMVNVLCGPGFVNASLPAPLASVGAVLASPSMSPVVGCAVLIMLAIGLI